MSVLDNKPIFTLNIHAYNTSYFVRLNGIAVHKEFYDDGQVTLSLPVNHWMHPKKNILGVDILPPNEGDPVNSNAQVRLELQVHTEGNPENIKSIATLVFEEKHLKEGNPTISSTPAGHYNSQRGFEPDERGDVFVSEITATPRAQYEGAILYERTIAIPSSLPLWAFFESDELPDYDTMSDEDYYAARDNLLIEYEKIQRALESGDIDNIMPLFEERSQETDAAFYFEPGTTQKELRADFLDAVGHDDLKIVELVPDQVGITLEENRRLVSLTRSDEGAAIGFNFISRSGSVSYPIVLRKQDGKWIITR